MLLVPSSVTVTVLLESLPCNLQRLSLAEDSNASPLVTSGQCGSTARACVSAAVPAGAVVCPPGTPPLQCLSLAVAVDSDADSDGVRVRVPQWRVVVPADARTCFHFHPC
jgi:hypothetical protein